MDSEGKRFIHQTGLVLLGARAGDLDQLLCAAVAQFLDRRAPETESTIPCGTAPTNRSPSRRTKR
jgi:hypothetical protein